jgi:hypothetical protein
MIKLQSFPLSVNRGADGNYGQTIIIEVSGAEVDEISPSWIFKFLLNAQTISNCHVCMASGEDMVEEYESFTRGVAKKFLYIFDPSSLRRVFQEVLPHRDEATPMFSWRG